MKLDKRLSALGGLCPVTSHQELCPWTPVTDPYSGLPWSDSPLANPGSTSDGFVLAKIWKLSQTCYFDTSVTNKSSE